LDQESQLRLEETHRSVVIADNKIDVFCFRVSDMIDGFYAAIERNN
jgi:hypothetical protein